MIVIRGSEMTEEERTARRAASTFAAAVRAAVEHADRQGEWTLDVEPIREALAALEGDGAHVYLSTGCRHNDHDYCTSMVGVQGEKRPGVCKFCDARCVCPCHVALDAAS